MNNSTLSGNSADLGGGILNPLGSGTHQQHPLRQLRANTGGGIFNINGTLTVTSSTLSGNSATNSGGGIYNVAARLTVTNSTLSGNSAATPAAASKHRRHADLDQQHPLR